MYVKFFLLALVFGGSVFVWCQLVGRWLRREPILNLNEEPRTRWHSAGEMAVAFVALFWAMLNLQSLYWGSSTVQPTPPDQTLVAGQAGINFALSMILTFVLVSDRRPLSGVGMTTSNLSHQIAVGVRGYLAAALPMAISMAATLPFRGPESQHSLLKLLTESPDVLTVVLIAVLAAVSVPLLEELIFRVILQGWLTTLFPAPFAISVVAVLFALVHGWRNGLALLPLAFILGYVFHRRHSYLAVVVIHGLFNATMLILQLPNPQTPSPQIPS